MTDDAIEFFEERAAIKEYCAGIGRAQAESAALREVSVRYGKDVAKQVQQHRESRQ